MNGAVESGAYAAKACCRSAFQFQGRSWRRRRTDPPPAAPGSSSETDIS